MNTFRIFLSSPGDVAADRTAARDLLLGLARGAFVRGRVHIDVVSWDDLHGGATMDARYTAQEAVNRSVPTPGECDLTVVLLWGRMGTPLTEPKADGTRYLSGTEWEFENALAANKPVVVYRRTEKVLLDPDDPEFDDKAKQKRRVDAFFKRFEGEGGTLLHAYASYASTDDLLERLRTDVERHLSELLRKDEGRNLAAKEVAGARLSESEAYRLLSDADACPTFEGAKVLLDRIDPSKFTDPDLVTCIVFSKTLVEFCLVSGVPRDASDRVSSFWAMMREVNLPTLIRHVWREGFWKTLATALQIRRQINQYPEMMWRLSQKYGPGAVGGHPQGDSPIPMVRK